MEQNHLMGKLIRSDLSNLLEQLGLTYDMKKEKYPKVHLWKHQQKTKKSMQSNTCASVLTQVDGLLLSKLSDDSSSRAKDNTFVELSTTGVWKTRSKFASEVAGAMEA